MRALFIPLATAAVVAQVAAMEGTVMQDVEALLENQRLAQELTMTLTKKLEKLHPVQQAEEWPEYEVSQQNSERRHLTATNSFKVGADRLENRNFTVGVNNKDLTKHHATMTFVKRFERACRCRLIIQEYPCRMGDGAGGCPHKDDEQAWPDSWDQWLCAYAGNQSLDEFAVMNSQTGETYLDASNMPKPDLMMGGSGPDFSNSLSRMNCGVRFSTAIIIFDVRLFGRWGRKSHTAFDLEQMFALFSFEVIYVLLVIEVILMTMLFFIEEFEWPEMFWSKSLLFFMVSIFVLWLPITPFVAEQRFPLCSATRICDSFGGSWYSLVFLFYLFIFFWILVISLITRSNKTRAWRIVVVVTFFVLFIGSVYSFYATAVPDDSEETNIEAVNGRMFAHFISYLYISIGLVVFLGRQWTLFFHVEDLDEDNSLRDHLNAAGAISVDDIVEILEDEEIKTFEQLLEVDPTILLQLLVGCKVKSGSANKIYSYCELMRNARDNTTRRQHYIYQSSLRENPKTREQVIGPRSDQHTIDRVLSNIMAQEARCHGRTGCSTGLVEQAGIFITELMKLCIFFTKCFTADQVQPRRPAGRIILFAWYVFHLVVFTLFTGNLVTTLVMEESFIYDIESIDDIIRDPNKLKICINEENLILNEDGTGDKYLPGHTSGRILRDRAPELFKTGEGLVPIDYDACPDGKKVELLGYGSFESKKCPYPQMSHVDHDKQGDNQPSAIHAVANEIFSANPRCHAGIFYSHQISEFLSERYYMRRRSTISGNVTYPPWMCEIDIIGPAVGPQLVKSMAISSSMDKRDVDAINYVLTKMRQEEE